MKENAPNVLWSSIRFENTNDQDKNEFLIYEIGNSKVDIIVEMGINTRTEKVEHFNVPKMIPDTEYQQMMRNLNSNQRKYILNTSKDDFILLINQVFHCGCFGV